MPDRNAGTSIAGSWKKSPLEETPNLAFACGPSSPKKMKATVASTASVTGNFQVTGLADSVGLWFFSGWGFPSTGEVAVVLMRHLRWLRPAWFCRRSRPSSCAG